MPKKPQYDPNSVPVIAWHEAGHAVASVVVGKGLKAVVIGRRRKRNGRFSVGRIEPLSDKSPPITNANDAMPGLIVLWAGPCAESSMNGEVIAHLGWRGDFEEIFGLAIRAVCREACQNAKPLKPTMRVVKRLMRKRDLLVFSACGAAEALVAEHWTAIAKVADLLMKRKRLSGKRVAAIVKECWPQTAADSTDCT